MLAPSFSAADYLALLQRLFPIGRIWPRDSDAIQTETLSGFAPTFARVNDRANYLLVDAFPTTTYELLPEWEKTLGLPDPCAGPAQTLQGRRGQVVARLTATDSPTPASFIAQAAKLGYTITITQFAPARVGRLAVGQPLYGAGWAHVWQINAPLTTVTSFRVGVSAVGDPLTSFGNAPLECSINARAPAHTTVKFSYT